MRGRMAQINDLPLKMALGGDTFCAPREGVERGGGGQTNFLWKENAIFSRRWEVHMCGCMLSSSRT